MKQEIQEAIQDLVTPEVLSVYLDIIDTLLEKDYGLALDELNQVVMLSDDNCDSAMLTGRIHDVLYYAMSYVLNDFGIVMLPEANLKVMHDIYKSLIYMPLYIIPDDIAHILQSDYDTVETIAQLVPYFTELTPDDVEPFIESVSIECITTIQKAVNLKLSNASTYVGSPVPVERIRVINKLLATNDRSKFSMMLELADAGVRVGRDYEELLNISFEGLEAKTSIEAAAQMVGLAFFSNIPVEGIWQKIDVSLDEYTDNPMERRFMIEEIVTIKRNLGDLNEAA